VYGLEHLALRFLLEDYLCITVPDGECILDFRFPPIGVKKLLIYVFLYCLFVSSRTYSMVDTAAVILWCICNWH
jgi:hypothetical protein